MMLEKHADEDCALHAIKGLRSVYDDLDEKELQNLAQSIVEKSRVDEIKASALLLEAWNRSRGDTTKDPERLKDKEDIQRGVLYGFPKTRPGKEMSGVFYGPALQSFFVAERKWVDEIMRLQKEGAAPEAWPKQPISEFTAIFEPIAAAGHHSASQFVNRLYPGYEQAARQSLGFGYQWLVTELGTYYSDGAAGPWNGVRADLASVLFRQYPTEKWMYGAVKRVTGGIEVLPVERVEPGLQALLEKNKDPRVVPWVLFCLGQCAKMRGDQAGYQRAIEYFAKVRAEFPDSDVSMAAEAGRAELVKVMPGAPAPSVEVVDDMGQKWSVGAYKGRVLLLEIWSFEFPACLQAVPARAALQKELASKPFSIAGVNFDSVSRETFAERTKDAGITWRTALVNYTDPIMAGWEVRAFPTTVLIDKQGIIRARNLPWAEMADLARKLVDE
jgi:thiol-disulfide isomerase/thioredoxin